MMCGLIWEVLFIMMLPSVNVKEKQLGSTVASHRFCVERWTVTELFDDLLLGYLTKHTTLIDGWR
jgi:hypothetical protein